MIDDDSGGYAPIELAIDYANTGREPALDFSYTVDTFLSSAAEEKRGTSFARVSLALSECRSKEDLSGGQVVFPSTGFSAYNLTVSPSGSLCFIRGHNPSGVAVQIKANGPRYHGPSILVVANIIPNGGAEVSSA
jgi:hypothetical protein